MPLGRYAQLSDLEKVKECLRSGADINWTNPDSKTQIQPGGETCLMKAIDGDIRNPRKYQVIEYLLSLPGLDVNKQDYSGATALVYAVYSGECRAARLLMTHPHIDPSIKTWADQCSGNWEGGWKAGKCALDLVDRIQYVASRDLCNEMREVFGIPELPPPEVLQLEEIKTPAPTGQRMKKIISGVVSVVCLAGIIVGVKLGGVF